MLEKLVRENIQLLKPYSSARSEYDGEATIFLDANENNMASVDGMNRYPDPLQKDLKQVIGIIKNVPSKNTFLGNGSDEAIDILIRIFCNPGVDNIVICPPTYGMYEVCANINDVIVKQVPLLKSFQLDINAIQEEVDSNTKLIFICSPNNPTGNLIDEKDIESLLIGFNGIVVIDEAYIDFAPNASFLSKLDQYPNLVVLQTLSKAWGLAGLRLGMAFASAAIINLFNKVKPPYNISKVNQQTGLNALSDKPQFDDWVNNILSQRTIVNVKLKTFDFILNVYPSDANFILIKVPDAIHLYNYLKAKGIIVRNRSSLPLCDNCLRISIGTEQENNILINTLKTYSYEKEDIIYR